MVKIGGILLDESLTLFVHGDLVCCMTPLKEKSTGLASTVASHTLPLLPSVHQPKFSVSPASVLFFRLSHASVRFGLAFS